MPFNLLGIPEGLAELAASPVSAPDLTVPSQHKGLFGIHGNLRNILGILGDSLIAGNGGRPIFTPSVEDEKVSDAIAKLPIVRHVVAHGETKLSFDLLLTKKKDGPAIRVDIRFVKRDEWGSALLYFTGDKEHNITLRKIAIKNGWKLNEYGLFEGEKRLASKEEEDIYKKLGLTWVDPTKRTGTL